MSSGVPTRADLEKGLVKLLEANPHRSTKGKDFVDWLESTFNTTARISHITEDRQCGNRVSEQFRYKTKVVVFLCDEVVKEESLCNYIVRNLNGAQEVILAIRNKKPFEYFKLLLSKTSPFSRWCEEELSLKPHSLVDGGKTEFKDYTHLSRNRIITGAPGTGKSFSMKEHANATFDEDAQERVTFYSTYSYGNFVGTYKPVSDGGDIKYSYVPGPFMRVLTKALLDSSRNFLLVIEELNRANAAAVFGDMFQLLDRDKGGESTYTIAPSEDVKKYLTEMKVPNIDKLYLPSNMFIWGTMNSADQGVFPTDTAFKRRWTFEYLDINKGETIIEDESKYPLGKCWNALRKDINERLKNCRINEDKFLGPFFISLESLEDNDSFLTAFREKVLMYLFEDAGRIHRKDLFTNGEVITFSELCAKFGTDPNDVFSFELKRYNAYKTESSKS